MSHFFFTNSDWSLPKRVFFLSKRGPIARVSKSGASVTLHRDFLAASETHLRVCDIDMQAPTTPDLPVRESHKVWRGRGVTSPRRVTFIFRGVCLCLRCSFRDLNQWFLYDNLLGHLQNALHNSNQHCTYRWLLLHTSLPSYIESKGRTHWETKKKRTESGSISPHASRQRVKRPTVLRPWPIEWPLWVSFLSGLAHKREPNTGQSTPVVSSLDFLFKVFY